ncbi:hypothetical protein Hanom_Chr11g01043891 [Helianthus anomalus]
MKMTRFQTVQMQKNKPLDKSRKAIKTLGTKWHFTLQININTYKRVNILACALLISYQLVSSDSPQQKRQSALSLEKPDHPSGILLLLHRPDQQTERIQTPVALCTHN